MADPFSTPMITLRLSYRRHLFSSPFPLVFYARDKLHIVIPFRAASPSLSSCTLAGAESHVSLFSPHGVLCLVVDSIKSRFVGGSRVARWLNG